MNWKDLSLRVKLGCGFGGLLLLVIVLALGSQSGIDDIIDDAEVGIASNNLLSVIGNVEVAHLKWSKSVAMHLLQDNENKLDVVLDDHKCSFGKWLYGAGRREAEELVPTLASLLKSIEQPHYNLHISASEIIQARKEPGGLNAAREIFLTKSTNALEEVSGDLEKIKLEIDRNMVTTEKMLKGSAYQGNQITWEATGIVLLGLIMSIILSETIRGRSSRLRCRAQAE